MSPLRHWAWAASRLVLAAFCWVTSLYAFITSSAFAYLQFIRPRVFPWVGQLADWHAEASIGWLVLLAAVLWRDIRGSHAPGAPSNARRVRLLAVAGLALAAAACFWNLRDPVLPRLTDGPQSLAVGVLALAPLVWLALIDQARGVAYLGWQRTPEDEIEFRAFEGRLLAASMATAVFLTVLYAALTSLRLAGRFEPDLLTPGLARGFAASLVNHLVVLVAPFLLIACLVRATRRRFMLQYALISAVFVGLFSMAFARLVGDALSLHGASAALAAVATAVSIVGTWTGLRLRTLQAERAPLESALDLYVGSSGIRASEADGRLRVGLAAIVRFLLVGVVAYAAMVVSSRIDWDFVVLDTGVLVVWLTSWTLVYRLMPFSRDVNDWALAASAAVPLAAAVAISVSGSMRGPLNRYAVYNPSFRLADSLLRDDGAGSSGFDRYLRAHTGLTDVAIAPVDLAFVRDLRAASTPPPPVFLFVVDSLRPDYLAPYNPAVRFTPRIAEFAADSVVFTNAITRYGGTGLSVPAMWAGAALVHKQYVTPFHPMNTLEKLLDANGYRKVLGLDSIMRRLLVPSPAIDELDRGRPVMDYEFCRTLDELQSKLASGDDSRPVFAYTLPQDIHMSRLPRSVEAGEEYRMFYAPYATKVHGIDACFGRFLDALKQRKLYDDSLIVLTADHGEMLGEEGRFGHSYHLFPQIVQVPLIVHLPAAVARAASVDTDAVSLTTDIVPTMYAALGYDPSGESDLMGRSLVASNDRLSAARRRDTYVVAASYGAVYAAARHNARRLYVADAVRGGDRAFERDRAGAWHPVRMTAGLRAVNQFAIRRHVDELARLYHVVRN